jgi:predicted amidophosphoribosyltransferase
MALCRTCAGSLEPSRTQPVIPGATGVGVAYRYSGAARALVLGLKLRGDSSCAGPLVDGMARRARALGCGAPVITWVPARRRDLAVRGVDHARLLAGGVASHLGIQLLPLVKRTSRPVADQAGLSASERTTNLVGAFRAGHCPTAVALIDDLVTTGATAAACISALRAGGATMVWVIAACGADDPAWTSGSTKN